MARAKERERGHAGVAVSTPTGWLFNAGDAYLHRGELDLGKRHMPPGLAIYGAIMATDPKSGAANLDRLRSPKRGTAVKSKSLQP